MVCYLRTSYAAIPERGQSTVMIIHNGCDDREHVNGNLQYIGNTCIKREEDEQVIYRGGMEPMYIAHDAKCVCHQRDRRQSNSYCI